MPRRGLVLNEGDSIETASPDVFRLLAERSFDFVAFFNGEGLVTYASPSCERILGYAPSELVGKPLRWLLDPAEEEERQARRDRILGSPGERIRYRYRIRHKDGSYRVLESEAINLLEDERVRVIVANSRDITEELKSHEALTLSEQRFRALADRLHDGLVTHDANGVVTYQNAAISTMLGYEPEDHVGHHLLDFVHPEDVERVRATMGKTLQTPGHSERQVARLRSKGGAYLHLESIVTNMLHHPAVGAVVVSLRDVTLERQAQATLERSERRLKALTERAGGGLAVVDANLKLTYLSRPADARWKPLGKLEDIFANFHDDDRQRVFAALKRVQITPRGLESFTVRVASPEGDFRVLDFDLHNLLDDDAVAGVIANYRDVTARVRAEEAANARASQQAAVAELGIVAVSAATAAELEREALPRLLSVLDLDAIEVIEVAPDGVNLQVASGLGIRSETYGPGLDSPCGYAIMHDAPVVSADLAFEARFRVPAHAREAGFTRCACAVVHDMPRPRGALLAWRKGGQPFSPDDQHVLQAAASLIGAKRREATARDELEKTQAQLRSMQKMEAVGRLAAGVAHDFNNLLVGILGYASILEESLQGDSARIEDVRQIKTAGERAADLTRQILAFSRQQVLKRSYLDINPVIQGLLKLLRRVTRADVVLDFIPGQFLGSVFADPGQLEQVLVNLAVNASDAMPEGGRLTLETSAVVINGNYQRIHPDARPGRYVLLTVSDTGVGMTKPVLERVFEPFFTTKELGRGTGLGLATAHGIVHQHGGMIQAYSEPGQGTVFKVYLPVAERPASTVERRPMPRATGGNETILLADDEVLVRKVTARVLENAGYRVVSAGDGLEAVKLFEERPDHYGLVLLDVVMPHLSGPQALKRIREIRPNARYLLASGYSAWAIDVDSDTARKTLQKPYDPDELLRRVRAAIDE